MGYRVDEEWKKIRAAEIADVRPINVVTSFNQAAQWLIKALARAEVPFQVIQLGGGVKRITTDVGVCKKCSGTGRSGD